MSLDKLLLKGLLSVTVQAIEFSPKPGPEGPKAKNKPTLWEARFSSGGNGDVVAKRKTPDAAFKEGAEAFLRFKKTPRVVEDDSDGMELI